MNHGTVRPAWILLIFLIAAIGLASCHSDGGDQDDDPIPGDDDSQGDDDASQDDDDDDAPPPDRVPILDARGREIVLRGANFMAVEYTGKPADYEQMARQWGFNAVRILIDWPCMANRRAAT